MKITFLSPTLNMGGGTKVLSIYADFLEGRGHEVVIVSLPNEKPTFKVSIRRILRLQFNHFSKEKSYFDESKIKQYVLNKHRPIVTEDLPDADIVIATWWETAAWLESIDDKKGKKVYFVQGYEIWEPIPKEKSMATYQSKMHKIVVSRWLQDTLSKEHNVLDADYVPNAFDANYFNFTQRQKQKSPTVGFLVSNASVKGMNVAIQVVNQLKKYYPDLKVITFGSQPPSESAAQSWPADVQFHLLPQPQAIKDIYSKCDVWLAASYSEGFNLTAMEAMACGTPVVSTKTGWPLEAIKTHENGFLAEIGDVDGLVDGVKCLLNLSDAKWQAISRSAAAATDHYSWEKSGEMFEQALLNQLMV